jgi:hypothetical protein
VSWRGSALVHLIIGVFALMTVVGLVLAILAKGDPGASMTP